MTTLKKTALSPVPAKKPAGTAPQAKAGARKAAVKPLLSKAFTPAKPEKAAVTQKSKKPKLVRDSFTIPKVEYGVLEDLKQRAARLACPVKKSELLRAGIKLLASLTDAAYLAALEEVPAIKTGRPALKK
ncbi:MAG: hypothetical protein ABIV07_04115 [Polaromonas sp.]